jgi:mannose-6-phosphate isomerase-like protein (cupin superfamily)
MKHVNEQDVPFRQGGDFGSKYLYRGQYNELGKIVIPPHTKYEERNHFHKGLEEVFYVIQGTLIIHIDGQKIRAKEGDVYTINPKEVHNLENDAEEEVQILFNKSPVIKGDRFEVD